MAPSTSESRPFPLKTCFLCDTMPRILSRFVLVIYTFIQIDPSLITSSFAHNAPSDLHTCAVLLRLLPHLTVFR